MPLIVITGIPSSGKTTRATQIKEYFGKNKNVTIISENEIIKNKNIHKNEIYKDSTKEKEIRGIMKSEVLRHINKDDVLILDGGNYIKGFRYEIFCGTKSAKTTKCTIHVDTFSETAWEFNEKQNNEEKYSKEIFDGLVQRYEPPCNTNRWDSPLFIILPEAVLPMEGIEKSLFESKPQCPNLSTLSQPLSDTNFLYQLDKITQDVITAILSAQKLDLEGDITIPGTSETLVISSDRTCSLPQLNRLKRQFLTYMKGQPVLHNKNISTLFVQYLNLNL